MPGIGSAATAVLLAHVGDKTSTIRLGAGGIMLSNHAPLQVAEQFGTLAALFPGASLSDSAARRERIAPPRTLQSDPDEFPATSSS